MEGGANTAGLAEFTEPVTGNPNAPLPLPPTVEMFEADSPELVKEVIPSANFVNAKQKPKFIVIHQWDAPEKKPTLQGVLATWQIPDGIAPHNTVDGNGDLYQHVEEDERAQHAGSAGNDGIGIECNPINEEEMYLKIRQLVAAARKRWGDLS